MKTKDYYLGMDFENKEIKEKGFTCARDSFNLEYLCEQFTGTTEQFNYCLGRLDALVKELG